MLGLQRVAEDRHRWRNIIVDVGSGVHYDPGSFMTQIADHTQ